MSLMPSLFVSHGAPTLPFENVPARDFLQGVAATLPRPRAIIAVSAHDVAAGVVVNTSPTLHAVHDFNGFPAALYELEYAAPGAPELATDVMARLQAAGIAVSIRQDGGIDHGVWVPLMLMYPAADIPVLSLSLNAGMSEAEHLSIGRALAGLREQGVLVLGSGSLTHNLRDLSWGEAATVPVSYAKEFADWVRQHVAAADVDALLDWRHQAPHARRAHPTTEHFMPFFVALGAGGMPLRGHLLHESFTYGALAMHAFAFD